MKYDLESLNVSKKYYMNTQNLKFEVDNFLVAENKKLNQTINETAEATVFLHNNFNELNLIFQNHKYFDRREKILDKLTSLYRRADRNKLDIELNKFKYYSIERVLWTTYLVCLSIAVLICYCIFGLSNGALRIFVELIGFPFLLSILLMTVASMIIHLRYCE